MQASPEPSNYFKDLADSRPFVLGAYFCAFAPWGLINNIDFISEKWRTVKRTRQLARLHLLFAILPVFYVAAYAEAQRRAEDNKELGAALVALVFNVSHVLRTLFGNIQVAAFFRWASDLADCMRAIRIKPSNEDSEDEKPIDEVLQVNHNVVDNELGGTDVTVKLSLRRIWASLKRGRLAPSEWLVTDDVWLSTVRWCGAFLCSLGMDWNCDVDTATLMTFFDDEFRDVLAFLDSTTWDINEDDGSEHIDEKEDLGAEKNKQTTTYSIHEMYNSSGLDISEIGRAAYDTPIRSFPDMHDPYLAYTFEFDSLCGSYPTDKTDPSKSTREGIAVAFVDQLMLVKYIGTKKLEQIRHCYQRKRFPTDRLWTGAFKLLIEQCKASEVLKDEEMEEMCSKLSRIPIFPCRLQMIPLWNECTNLRVLQASVHTDNEAAIKEEEDLANVASDVEEFCGKPMDVYEYYKNTGEVFKHHYKFDVVYGIVAESVRTFLADWLVSAEREPDWEPVVPLDYELEFCASSYASEIEMHRRNNRRLLWECQQALHTEVAKTCRAHHNLPSSAPLMMLFISSFPQVHIEEIASGGEWKRVMTVSDSDSDDGKWELNTKTSSSTYSEVKVSERVLCLSTEFVPSDVTVLIRQNLVTRRTTLKMTSDCHGARFIWEDWVNAMVGLMKGMMEYEEEIPVLNKRNIGMLPLQRVNLRKPMLALCPLHLKRGRRSSVLQSSTAYVWTGWPPFDWRVCQFEVNQWLGSFEMDLKDDEEVYSRDRAKPLIGDEAKRAALVVKKIMVSLAKEG